MKRRLTPVGIILTAAGLELFAYFVKRAGVTEIAEGIRRLGSGFLLILLISVLATWFDRWRGCFVWSRRIGCVSWMRCARG